MNTIKNDTLEIGVKTVGAELCSIKSIKTGTQYIWQADPAIWGSHAPVLFPVIGNIKNQQVEYKGIQYPVPRHGFIRNNENIEMVAHTANTLKYRLSYSEELLKIYPFKFELFISFILNGNKLTVKHEVVNKGEEVMYYSLGGHPGFNCPLFKDEKYEDYYLEFPEQESAQKLEVLSSGLIGEGKTPVLNNTKTLPLTGELFNDEAIIFKDLKSSQVAIKSRNHNNKIVFNFTGFPYIAFWAKPQSPYICIEPWQGIADFEKCSGKLQEKEGIVQLAAGSTDSLSYSIEIIEE